MKLPWKRENTYEVPPKPRSVNKQVSMIWDFMYNHLPGKLAEQDRKLWWQDVQIKFILALVGLILASLVVRLF